jgi:hypothetical protein
VAPVNYAIGKALGYDTTLRAEVNASIDNYEVFENVSNLLRQYTLKKYDKEGNEQDIVSLIEKDNYVDAAELAFNEGFSAAPYLALSIASPIYGSALIGASVTGQEVQKALKERPDASLSEIYGASILKGGVEFATNAIGGGLQRGILGIGKKLGTGTNAYKKAVDIYTKTYLGKIAESGIGLTKGGATNFIEEWSASMGNALVDAAVYNDPFEFKSANRQALNEGLVGLALGSPVGSLGAFNSLASKQQALEFLAPKKWQEDIAKQNVRLEQAKIDLNNAPLNRKEKFQKRVQKIESLIKMKKQQLQDSFDNLTKKEKKQYADNLNKSAEALSQIGNSKYTLDAQNIAKEDFNEANKQNEILVGKEIFDAEAEKYISKTLKNTERIEEAFKKAKQNVKNVKFEYISDINAKFDASFNSDTNTITINRPVAVESEQTNVIGHELLHYMMAQKFATDNASMQPLVDSFKNYLKETQPELYQRVQERINLNYTKINEQGQKVIEEGALEEYFNVFSDLVAKEKIIVNESLSDKIKNTTTRFLNSLGFGSIKLETGKDVFNFIRNYQKNISNFKFKQLGVDLKSSKIPNAVEKVVEEGKKSFSKSKASEKVQQIYEAQGAANAFDIIAEFKPIVDRIVNKYRDVPGFEYQLLKDEIETGKRGILDMIMDYTPEKAKGAPLAAYINSLLPKRAIEAANRILDTEFKADVTEAKGVTDTATEEATEVTEEAIIADEIKSLRKEIGLPKELITTVKNAVIKTFGTKLPNPQDPKFRLELQKRFRTELKKPMAKFVGKQEAYESFLRDNFKAIYDKLPQSLINRRFKDFAEAVLDENGKQLRERTAEGKKVFTKKKITKAEFIKYFLGSDVGRSTQGTRKTAIVEAIAEEIAFDATMEVLRDPDVINKYQDIAGITGEVLPENFKSLIAKQVDRAENFKFSKSIVNDAKAEYNLESQELARILSKTSLDKLSNKYSLISDAIIYEANENNIKFSLSSKEKDAAGKIINKLQNDILKNIESESVNFTDDLNVFILNKFNEEVEKDLNLNEILENVINATNTFITDKTGKNLISKAVLDTNGKLTRNYFLKIKQATGIALKKEIAELGYESSKKLLENRLKNTQENDRSTIIKNWFINESKAITTFSGLPNITKIKNIFDQVLAPLLKKYNIKGFELGKNPKGAGQKLFLNNTPINRYKSTTDIKRNFAEYIPQINEEANYAKQYILEILDYYKDNNLINEGKAHIKLLANDQIGALRKLAKAGMYVENLLTKETTLEHQTPVLEITLASNNFLDGKISQEQLEKEFDNAQINLVTKNVDQALTAANLKSSGKNRMQNNLVKNAVKNDIKNGKKYKNIESVYKDLKLSKSLNKEFNKILEQSTGVKFTETFSPVRATMMGRGKGKKFFIPYSADDFVGLLYATLARDKVGDQQMAWYEENLLRPFSRGIQQYEAAKQQALRDWMELKKEVKKDVPGGLKKQNESGFTNQDSVRLYMWNKQGMEIPGVLKKDIAPAIKAVRTNPKLKDFAERLMALNPEGYPQPGNDWSSGDITTDIVSYINGVKRSEFLTEWKTNVDKIFTDKNKNKLKALYGEAYIEALDNMLYRMEKGRNRFKDASKVEKAFMQWTNNSVGAIMFFNARSAVLQTLSAVNFINFSDNNPINAGRAFINQKQYWDDFSELFNSDFLKQRRTGLQTDVNADEIANAAATSTNKARAALSAILKFGFTPTQIADSFAIASGGASFYRNRINTYIKEGLSKKEAKTKAFTDFQEIAEETQQSARPDRISMQQAGSLGRLVLAFGNTPMQYARLTKKATLDLINERGDWKTNISKIAYYSVIQNIIFSALQQGLFALLFDDEDDEKTRTRLFRIGNSSFDTLLRGTGVYGAAAATVKNMILKIIDESKKSRPDYTKVAIEATAISPPINSKLRKLISAGKTFTYKQSKEKVFTEGFSLENPGFLAAGKVISAGTNLPVDRIVQKMDHINTAMESETELWQSIALALGWSEWDLGMVEKQTKKSKDPLKELKKIQREIKGIRKRR